jgi:hypothetical protein
MATIRVKMKEKTLAGGTPVIRVFEDRGRAGGSYSQNLSTDGPFAVITDCYGEQTYIPAADIEEIKVDSDARARW